jgi:DNA-binding SARP family transcriptional activator
VPPVHVELLGGFRVERIGVARPVVWQRRTAKTLTKLLAAHPRHSLHREEILELLWPRVPAKSALNRFGQALHAARRAFEPELLPRESSAYLQLTESVLSLKTEHVVIDADHFQQLAESALGRGNEEAYESALAAYRGELLPEDRYHDWCAERRAFLAELRIRLLVELADALEERGAQAAAADRLREVLRYDPTREDVHRRLIVLYAEMGTRDQAVRQFQMCREALQRELGLLPAESTLALYEEILADRTPKRLDAPAGDEGVVDAPAGDEGVVDAPAGDQGVTDAPAGDQGVVGSHRVAIAGPTRWAPMIALASALQHLRKQLSGASRADSTQGDHSHGPDRIVPDARARSRGLGASRSEETKGRGEDRAPPRDRRRGFLIFRIAWIAAILVSALVFLVGLFSGGDSSQQRAEVASAPPATGVGGEAQKKAQKTKTAGPRDDRSRRAKEQASSAGLASWRVPRGSAAQPGDAGGGAPVVTPQPAPRPKPTPSPRPKPTPAPPQVPVSSQPAAAEPAQTTVTVANNNTGSP